jgi:hypothetical protein
MRSAVGNQRQPRLAKSGAREEDTGVREEKSLKEK